MSVSTLTRTLPWSWYVEPAAARLEQERVFRRSWQYAGRAEQAAEPGQRFAARAGDVPVLVVRGRGGELRAFLNVCRHRGSLIVEGEGRAETIQCPYHAWTYELDGSLRAAPRADREAAFAREELGLVPVAVDAWGPFVLPLPGRAPRLLEGGRRLGRVVPAARERADRQPVRPGPPAGRRGAADGPVPLPLAEHGRERDARAAEPLDRPDRPDPETTWRALDRGLSRRSPTTGR